MMRDDATMSDERTDDELLSAIAEQRDAAAFNQLFERHQRAAYNLALHLSSNRAAAEEIVQEGMLRVWTSAASFRGEGNVKSWILKIVARQALKSIKNERRKQKEMELETKRESRGKSQPQESDAGELVAALRERLKQLPPLECQLLGLHFSGGLTQQEIGEALSIPQQTVSYKITESLKRLRSSLTAAGLSSVIPLVSTDGLCEAICSGPAAPAGLQAKVMSSLAGAKTAAGAKGAASARHAAKARHAATASSHTASWAAAITVVAVATGGAIWAAKTTPPPAPPAPPVAVAPAPAPAPAPVDPRNAPIPQGGPDMLVKWSFTDGAKPELVTMQGDWKWDAAKKAMAAPGFLKVILPIALPGNPVKITAHAKMHTPANGGEYGVMLVKGGIIVQPRTWKRTNPTPSDNVINTTYLFDHYMVEYFSDNISRIVELSESWEQSVPVVTIRNLYLYDFEVRGIKIEDIPAAIRNPLTLTQGMELITPEDTKIKPPAPEK